MLSWGSLVFLNPWILAGLLALPLLWWLLRAIPPAPQTRIFPGVRLLLGLDDEDREADKTPWWLLALRILAVAAALIGLAQPVLNPSERVAAGDGPLLVIMDQGWSSAPDWDQRVSAARSVLDEAERDGREVYFWRLADGAVPQLGTAAGAKRMLASLTPAAWAPDHAAALQTLDEGNLAPGQTIWLHDGLDHGMTGSLLERLADLGPLRLIGPQRPAMAVTPLRLEDGRLATDVLRAEAGPQPLPVGVVAFAATEEGGERRIAVGRATFGDSDTRATVQFDLPVELQGDVTRIMMVDGASAGGAAFADGAIRRVTATVVGPENDGISASLTSPTHYLEQAMAPWADLQRAELAEALAGDPAALILIDQGDMSPEDREAIADWVSDGGLLLRFAGPRLAAAISDSRFGGGAESDPLLPVTLRRGGRVLGGALAWSAPRTVGPFPQASPFRGLVPPEEVQVRTQVLAEPSPDLSKRVWAALDDGTPLVTAKPLGDGEVVLFHVTSDAEWSSLPLSGLFVEMLGRLIALAPGRAAGTPSPDALADTLWRAERLMGPDGRPMAVPPLQDPVSGERIALGGAARDLPPGVYLRANRSAAGPGAASVVINLMTAESELVTFPAAPIGVVSERLGGTEPVRYGPGLLALAVLLLTVDVLATLFVSGRLTTMRRGAAAIIAAIGLSMLPQGDAYAQADAGQALSATAETTLGYILTGDPDIDEVSARAMIGLGNELTRRTAVEPGPPVGVDPASDDMSFYPVLYWPLTARALPEKPALDALARYLTGGGLLIIDTQNGASGFGGASATQMRQIARSLNLPPLAPVDADHVLTRSFYLLNTFPGRWRGGRVWAEAAPANRGGGPDAADIPQFDRIDDNVSPVVVGSADWASAWAVDQRGFPMFAIGRSGDRQREMAIRFGVNLVMYALTGNYKSDQVHAPEVLRRLGQ